MINVTPAILTNDIREVADLFERYVELGFTSIDIDFAEESFVGNKTVGVKEVLDTISLEVPVSIGFHLMMKNPQDAVEAIMADNTSEDLIRIYVHQEADIGFLEDLDIEEESIGVAIMAKSELKDIEYYDNFDEIQLMTIETGKQGNPFLEDVLERVEELRDLGFDGDISVDGGINLKTAPLISEYEIDRVSVGSYFQTSKDIEGDWQKLQLALNR